MTFGVRRVSGTGRPQSAFTLIEMLVVIGIIIAVAAMALPLFSSLSSTGKLRKTRDALKSHCVYARSNAIRSRRMKAVTILEKRMLIVTTDYETLRHCLPVREIGAVSSTTSDTLTATASVGSGQAGYFVTLLTGDGVGQTREIKSTSGADITLTADWATTPAADDEFVIGGKDYTNPNPHLLSNYSDDEDERYDILTKLSTKNIEHFPSGVRADLDRGGEDADAPEPHGWSYIFLPNGGAWTVTAAAGNSRDDEDWKETTYIHEGKPSGPLLYGPRDEESSTVIVYAMTGQAVARNQTKIP
jgi:type II secretory pathway pseudopilin PulG